MTDDAIQVRIPGYRIVKSVGAGGMAVVYEAVEEELDRRVALKVLNPSSNLRPELMEQFVNEARTMSKLEHNNIAPIYRAGNVGQVPFVTMQLVSGGTLERALEFGMDFRKAAEIMAKIGRAVQFAHDNGVIHRDIKPSNILLTEDGEPKLVDFGISRIVHKARVTPGGTPKGTPGYMSPEQAMGTPGDARSDVYGLGATLYEVITKMPPFEGEGPAAVLRQIMQEKPIPANKWIPDLPSALNEIIMRALEKEPADRFSTAAEFSRALEAFLESGRPPAPRRRRRSPAPYLVMALGIAAVVAAAAILMVRPEMKPYAFVYRGPGAWAPSAQAASAMLKDMGYEVVLLDERGFLRQKLESRDVVLIPGGWSYDQYTALRNGSMDNIRNFVKEGGTYIGLCAGAFLACDSLTWEGIGQNYGLGICRYHAVGPIEEIAPWPDYVLTTLRSRREGIPSETSVLYYGGPYFVDPEPDHVYATFSDGSAAVLKVPFGKGRVILSGAHLERQLKDGGHPVPGWEILRELLR